MGLAFKENCPDIRNTKVIDIIDELKTYKINVDVVDPWCDEIEAKKEYNLDLIKMPSNEQYNAVIIAVAHEKFKEMGLESIKNYVNQNTQFMI